MKNGNLNNNRDMDHKFNTFHNTFIQIFLVSFPWNTQKVGKTRQEQLTKGIKISCEH